MKGSPPICRASFVTGGMGEAVGVAVFLHHLRDHGQGKKGTFPHAFFEASSVRKVDGKYCFVYSSQYNHDLCYAMSDYPDRDFKYGGVLIDLGDLFLNGHEDESHANNYLGNTHGGNIDL